MTGSIARVKKVIKGEAPDRTPLFDLLRNDDVISHFAGEQLTLHHSERLIFKAYNAAIDATRPVVRLPQKEEAAALENGRNKRRFRWTTWVDRIRYADAEAYAEAKRKILKTDPYDWGEQRADKMQKYLGNNSEYRAKPGGVFFFPSGNGVGLMGVMNEVGIEQFVYYNADYPGLIDELLEHQTIVSETFIHHLPQNHGIDAVFLGDDIAFSTGPMLAPQWFHKHYFHRLRRITDGYHAKGIKVLYHSDGNLNSLLDGLVDSGIDGLNPIEVLAGMDVAEIHSRYPRLFMAGGIDVSQLLPFGSPEEIRKAVSKTIDAAEGRIMIGSSTEVHNEVPVENYLALRDAVLNHI